MKNIGLFKRFQKFQIMKMNWIELFKKYQDLNIILGVLSKAKTFDKILNFVSLIKENIKTAQFLKLEKHYQKKFEVLYLI